MQDNQTKPNPTQNIQQRLLTTVQTRHNDDRSHHSATENGHSSRRQYRPMTATEAAFHSSQLAYLFHCTPT